MMKLKITAILLLVASVAFSQGRGGGRQMTWDESLNLTTEQMQQITELRESMQPAMQTMRQNNRTLEQELRQLQHADDADQERVAELEAAIAANEAAMGALMDGHRTQIRNLLSEDQQLIFDQHDFGPREDRGRGMNSRRNGNNADGSKRSRFWSGRR